MYVFSYLCLVLLFVFFLDLILQKLTYGLLGVGSIDDRQYCFVRGVSYIALKSKRYRGTYQLRKAKLRIIYILRTSTTLILFPIVFFSFLRKRLFHFLTRGGLASAGTKNIHPRPREREREMCSLFLFCFCFEAFDRSYVEESYVEKGYVDEDEDGP